MAFCVDCDDPSAVPCEECDRPLCDDCADDGDGLCLQCGTEADEDDPEWDGLDYGGDGEF